MTRQKPTSGLYARVRRSEKEKLEHDRARRKAIEESGNDPHELERPCPVCGCVPADGVSWHTRAGCMFRD